MEPQELCVENSGMTFVAKYRNHCQYVKNELGAPISDPHIGDRVSTNNVEGMLINPQLGIRKIIFFGRDFQLKL